MNGMNFSQALEQLKLGALVYRAGWNGKGMWLELQRPDEHSKMSLPYVFMKTADDQLVPWVAPQSDILADDWFVRISRDTQQPRTPTSTATEPSVRITSEGVGYNTHVYVGGVEIPATEVRWSVAADGTATATLVVPDVKLDVKAYEIVRKLPPADDDGTAGTREPRTPEPTPVAPSATTTAQDAGITLTVYLDGKVLYDAIRPHSEAERARWRLRHGNWPLT